MYVGKAAPEPTGKGYASPAPIDVIKEFPVPNMPSTGTIQFLSYEAPAPTEWKESYAPSRELDNDRLTEIDQLEAARGVSLPVPDISGV